MTNSERILQPISDSSPCGVNIRENNNDNLQLYLKLKDLRATIINEENDSFENTQILVIDINSWQEIVSSSENLLSFYSKDLEIAIWVLEGLTRLEGFKGLNLGLKIVYQLLEKFEHQLHPKKSIEEYLEIQLASISMLSGKYETGSIIAPIYFCSLLSSVPRDSHSLWSFKKISETNNQSKSNYRVTKEIVLQSKELMSTISSLAEDEFLPAKLEITSCVENIGLLSKIINKNFGSQAPNLKNLINVITYCFNVVDVIAKIIEERKNLYFLTETAEQKDTESGNTNNRLLVESSIIADKAAAIDTLSTLVKFFRKNEPHSPVSYVLERALSWSRLSLPEVICEMMSDDARMEFCRSSGVPFIDFRIRNQEEDKNVK